jgi:hypothetical protein
MKKSELQNRLAELPDHPVIFIVEQDMSIDDDYVWMQGEPKKVYVGDFYLDTHNARKGFDGEYVDREEMRERVFDDPQSYGLTQNATKYEVEEYLDRIKETYVVIEVHP